MPTYSLKTNSSGLEVCRSEYLGFSAVLLVQGYLTGTGNGGKLGNMPGCCLVYFSLQPGIPERIMIQATFGELAHLYKSPVTIDHGMRPRVEAK